MPVPWKPALSVYTVTLVALASPRSAAADHRDPAPAVDPFSVRAPKVSAEAPRAPGYAGLGAESVSPEVVARFAPTALDPAVSRSIQTLLDIRGAGSGLVTARGDRMVFASKVTGTTQVWRQDGPGKLAVQLTGGEDATSPVALTRDERFILVSRDVGGSENPGLYLQPIEGGPLELILHAPKVQAEAQLLSDDGKAVYYRANDLDPSSYAIYRFDLEARTRTLVFDAPGLWKITDHRGDTWLMAKELGNAQTEIYQYDSATKQLSPLLGQGEVEEYAAKFGARAGQVLVRTNKLGDFQRLYSLEAGKLTPITPDLPHDVDNFWIDEGRTRIYYTVNDGGFSRLAVLDARTLRPLALPALPASDNVVLASQSRDGRFVQFTLEGATLVPQSVTWDWSRRKLTTWRVASAPELDPSKFAKATLESYPARDGTRIPMFVRRPASCVQDPSPCPVIVSFHGGPEGQATSVFSSSAQAFVDAGFVFVQPNVRGSLGYGKAWLHADDGPKRLAVITDIEDAATFIRAAWAKGGTAPRIGIMGGSYGGYSTLMGMTYFAGAYDAGVEIVGISNLSTFLANTAPYRRILRISEYGDPVKDKDALVQLSPITHIGRIKAPLLMIQGVNDPRVPVGEALQIHGELVRRNIPGELILFPDEGHGATKRGNVVAQLGHTLAFFQAHLQGD